MFKPQPKDFLDLPRPLAACVGRVAIEKNIEAFLKMPWSGGKIVIGDGPERARLQALYPDVTFTGYRFQEDLARHLAAADIMVFPSRTDTFGLVNLEAMACGVPVAAYPVTGPIDVIEDGVTGALDEDLGRAAHACVDARPAGLPQLRAAIWLGRDHPRVRVQPRALQLGRRGVPARRR